MGGGGSVFGLVFCFLNSSIQAIWGKKTKTECVTSKFTATVQ